ncbi:MAG: NADH:flavin oxidoreductase/NADH oxidase [Pseudobdellovibrionaceae bacterium]
MAHLFTSSQFRSISFKNRIFVSPMCQYSSVNGMAQTWHLVHLGGFALGGAAMVMTEAAAVSPEGRISPDDLGIWSDEHAAALRPIVDFIHKHGSVSGIQLAHAGRKASTASPWKGSKPVPIQQGGWQPFAPSALSYKEEYPTPKEMNAADLQKVEDDFVRAAERAHSAGFKLIEIHMAHGYLFHEFLSPISNQRQDRYGGSLENRMRFPLQVFDKVRAAWPADLPVFVRISATDWVEGGWDLEQSIVFCQELKKRAVDLIDVSSGGLSPEQKIDVKPLYQVPFAESIRKKVDVPTGAVGLITQPEQAEKIVKSWQADVVFLGRELLRDPHWPLRAAEQLRASIVWPLQYERAKNFDL